MKSSSRNIGWYSKSSASRKSESLNFQRRPLIIAHEITPVDAQETSRSCVQGRVLMRCGRAIYFWRRKWTKAAEVNRFVKH